MSGGGQTQPTQTTTQQVSPQAQELMNLALPAVRQYAANVPQRYQGPTVAGFDPVQQGAQEQILNEAQRAGGLSDWSTVGTTGLANTLTSGLGTGGGGAPYQRTPLATSSNIFNDPGIWNPQFNAGTTAAINAAQRPTWQALTEQALPAIRGGAITAGGFGGSRQGIAEGLGIGRATQAAGDQAAKIAEDLYGQNLAAVNNRYNTNIGAQNQRYGTDVGAETARYGQDVTAEGQRINQLLATYGTAPSLQSQTLLPGYAANQVGDVRQQMAQAGITGDIQNFNYDQLAPFLQAKDIMSLVQGLPGASTTSTANLPGQNPFSSAIGGALSGAALGSAFPGIGTGIGALGGAAASTLPFLFK